MKFGIASMLAQVSEGAPSGTEMIQNPALLAVVGGAAVLLVVGILVARRLDQGKPRR